MSGHPLSLASLQEADSTGISWSHAAQHLWYSLSRGRASHSAEKRGMMLQRKSIARIVTGVEAQAYAAFKMVTESDGRKIKQDNFGYSIQDSGAAGHAMM